MAKKKSGRKTKSINRIKKSTPRKKRYTQGKAPPAITYPPRHEMSELFVRPVTLRGDSIDLVPLDYSHIPDLQVAARTVSMFKWFIDGWMILHHHGDVSPYVCSLIKDCNDHVAVPLAVYHKQSRRVIGVTKFYNVKRYDLSMSIASWYAKRFQGKSSVNTEAKCKMLQYAFEKLPCRRVEFSIDENNKESIESIKKIGAKLEGKHHSDVRLADGSSRNSLVFGVTDILWKEKVKAHLMRKLGRIYTK